MAKSFFHFVLMGSAASAFAISAAGATDPDAPALRGALYPADIVATIVVATGDGDVSADDAMDETPRISLIAPEQSAIARALGPAAYILDIYAPRETFRAHVRRAIGRHPAFHAQVSTLDEAAAGRKRARSALYPQISSQFRGDYVLARDFASDTDNVVEALRPREQFTAGLSASQLVFDGGATFQRIKSARARQSEFENSISARVNDLAFEALTIYHDLLTHQALAALGDAIVRRHAEILSDVRERERLGAGSKADVTRAGARLAAARARVSEIRESARLADVRYQNFFGERPGALKRPDIGVLAVDSREEAVAASMNHNPELAVASARSDASTADYKAAKGDRLPEVRVSVDAVKFDVFNSGDDFDVRAGVDVQYDIFSGGLRAANIAEAGSRARQAQFAEEQIRQEIARDAAFAYERSEGAGERLDALADAMIAHDETRDLVLERYRVARGDLIDVLQAENDYFEAAVAYITGLANRDLASYAMMEHTGDLLRFFSPQDAENDEFIGGYDG
ncbi:MAG: TolC family protein [Pseudomonadota bacterium]